MMDINKLRSLALDGDLAAMQAIVIHLERVEKERDDLRAAALMRELLPYAAIGKILTEVMNIAVANGADSRSMPDEYVEVAAWLCRVPSKQPTTIIPEGWKLVPIEPTETMINEGSCASTLPGPRYISEDCARQCWEYMIAATPKVKP